MRWTGALDDPACPCCGRPTSQHADSTRSSMTSGVVHPVKIEDFGTDGHCINCGRGRLRWIATLSDDRQVGTECGCAIKICGRLKAWRAYLWVADYKPIAERRERDTTFVLWENALGTETRTTANAELIRTGAERGRWRRMGWLPAGMR